MKIFIDEIGWWAISDKNHPLHREMQEQFQYYLDGGHSFYTTNVIVGSVISRLKSSIGSKKAIRFAEIIDEAWLGTHLHFLWIGRRTQRDAIKLFKKFPDYELSLFDYANIVLMNRRNIRFIITTNSAYNKLGFKIVPENQE
ncbi:MAG: type II toxin-antitoxin system VapC family toxin [Calditrichaeota bacterium]|nr:type II toxin-antitoxin system VapC family toxin [Calditrichota bacterium]